MRCWACKKSTISNALLGELSDEDSETVTSYFGLIHINGDDDEFMPDDGSEYAGMVIICQPCVDEALDERAYLNFQGLQ